MSRPSAASLRAALVVIAASVGLAGCAQKVGVTRVRLSDRECLARAMYFESNRSSDAGMLAVGTVVMNRLKSGKYGSNVCEVVGAPKQFAPGVLTRQMTDSGAPRARRMADVVLSGKRHPGVQNAQFFHTAGYKFPYNNMRYVLVAGGNAFYDKTKPPKNFWGGEGRWGPPPAPSERIDGVMIANVEVVPDQPPSQRLAPAPAARRATTTVMVADAGSYGGIPTHEPLPGERQRALPDRRGANPNVYAALDEPVPSRGRIRQDNGLREEDRWRDQELAEDTGRQPASDNDWRERRDERIESTPLPRVVEADYDDRPVQQPARMAPSQRPARPAPRDADYAALDAAPAPQPSRNMQVASRPRTVDTRSRPVEADPGAMGWRTGAQPVASNDGGSYQGGGYQGGDDMGGYQPLSRAADEYQPAPVRRPAAPKPTRSYGGVALQGGDTVQQYGYR